MELVKDVYPLILENVDFKTLLSCIQVNSFFYKISKKEIEKRIEKIEIVLDEIYLKKIYLLFEDEKIEISETCEIIEDLLDEWFVYHFHFDEWLISCKLYDNILKYQEKKQNYKEIKSLIFDVKESEIILFNYK
jgi:hypothetical protein